MEQIIWLIDINSTLKDSIIDKVTRIASSFKKPVSLAVDNRVRSKERWYWRQVLEVKKLETQLAEQKSKRLDRIVAQFNEQQVNHSVHNVPADNYLASLDELLVENTLFIVHASANVLRNPMLALAKKYNCNILLLQDNAWRTPLSIAAAVDPLHENDRPAKLDHYIVELSRSFRKKMAGSLELVHCRFLSPLFLEHKKAISAIHTEAVEQFAKETSTRTSDITLLDGMPEHVLPRWVKSHQVDILCLGYIARSRVANYLMGSTTYALMQSIPCDLLMVHHD